MRRLRVAHALEMVTALAVTDMSKVARRFFHLVKGLPTWTVLARSPRLTHAIVGDEASLNALEAEWDDLFKRASAPTPFLRYSWVRLCWERHCAAHDTKLFIVVVRSEGRPVLIAPLVRQKDKLCFLDSLSPQYNDLLVENSVESASYVDYLWRVLSGARRVRRFRAKWVRDDSLLAPHLAKARQVKKVASYPAPFIDLDKFEDWTAYLRSLSKNLRLDHRRQLRKLAKRGQLELRMSNASACRNDVAWLFAHKRQWLDRTGKQSPWLMAAGTEKLFMAAAQEGIDSGRTWLTVLSLDGETIAAMINFREAATLFVSKTAYDPAWQIYSPSRTLFLLTIERAFQERLSKIDCLIGRYPPKDRLATGEIKVRKRAIRF